MNRVKLIEKGKEKDDCLMGLIPLCSEGMLSVKGGDSCGRFTACSSETKRNKCINTYIVHCANVWHTCEQRYEWQGGTEPRF